MREFGGRARLQAAGQDAILDVAGGGQGGVSFEFQTRFGVSSKIVDPRPEVLSSTSVPRLLECLGKANVLTSTYFQRINLLLLQAAEDPEIQGEEQRQASGIWRKRKRPRWPQVSPRPQNLQGL